jgi:hypothetical protein
MVMLALAGINVLVFELTSGRTIRRWDREASAPLAGRTAAVLSLAIWISIIFLGRWIGFTTTRASVGQEPDVNFDNLFPGAPDDSVPPGAPPADAPPKDN